MSSLTKHIIQKQVLQVETCALQQEGFSFQQQIRETYYDRLLPQMELLFDEIAGENFLIRLKELQLEVLISNSKNWEEELVHQCLQQMRLALRQQIKIPLQKKSATLPDFTSPFEDVETTFFYFLHRGSLPWHSSFKNNKEIETALLNQLEIWVKKAANNKSNFMLALADLLKDEKAIARLISQFSDALLIRFFESQATQKFLEKWMAFIENISPDIKRNIYWQTFIRTKDNKNIGEKENENFMLSIFLQQLQPYYDQLPLSHQRVLSLMEEDPELPLQQKNIAQQKGRRAEADENYFYINNAGLVIVQPFLHPFFEINRLWDNNQFINQQAYERAVLLSQYLISGENEFPESDLLLNKIICGYPLEATLPLQLNISEEEKNESEELLKIITHNWTINGKAVITTIDNLRASFLQRPGKLNRQSNGWLLQVEQRSYDMLLNSLPWTIGIIKQKWMPELLRVEWC